MKIKNLMMWTMSIALVMLAQVSFAQSASLKNDNWVLLGSRQVDYTLDRDVITLTQSAEPLTALKFNVNNGPINLHKCTVHFASGETQDVTFASTDNGQQIDLKGNSRKIEKVTFWYDTKNSSDKKAVVEVWGKKSSGTL